VSFDYLPLPTQVNQIDIAWVGAALAPHLPSGTILRNAAVEDVLSGTSTKIRIRVAYAGPEDNALPNTLIVKGGPRLITESSICTRSLCRRQRGLHRHWAKTS
jgi:hypothetical protein